MMSQRCRCNIKSCSGIAVDVSQYLVQHLTDGANVGLRQVGLKGKVAGELDVGDGGAQLVFVRFDVLPLTEIACVAVNTEDLHGKAFHPCNFDEPVRLFPRKTYEVELHGVAEAVDLGQRRRDFDVRMVGDESVEQVPIGDVDGLDLGQTGDLRC